MSSYSVQRAAKNLEDTILDLEDFFVDPLVDFLYHKGVIKHEDALDVYDYEEEQEKFRGLLAILNRLYTFESVLQHLESAMVILEQDLAAEKLAKFRRIYNSTNANRNSTSSPTTATISRWRRTSQLITADHRNGFENSQISVKSQDNQHEQVQYSKVSKIEQHARPVVQERGKSSVDDSDIYQNLTFPKRRFSNPNAGAEKFGSVSRWRNSFGNSSTVSSNKWLDFRTPKNFPATKIFGTLEEVKEEDPDQAKIYEDLSELVGHRVVNELRAEETCVLDSMSSEEPIYENLQNIPKEENCSFNTSSTITEVSIGNNRVDNVKDQIIESPITLPTLQSSPKLLTISKATGRKAIEYTRFTNFLSGGSSAAAVKVIERRSAPSWPWKKKHEKQAVDSCFHTIEQLKCIEDLKLHGELSNTSGECGLCRSVSRTLFDKITRYNWQCPPETKLYVVAGFSDPESFHFQPSNLVHLQLTAGGMELLDVTIFAFFPTAVTPIIPIEISSNTGMAAWDTKKQPNTICGHQLVKGSHLYIKTAAGHQRATYIDEQLSWPWEFTPKQPTIIDACIREIFQKSMLETLSAFNTAEIFSECLQRYVPGIGQNAVWCIIRCRGQQPYINFPRDSILVLHCEVQAENFYVLHFPTPNDLKSLSETVKLGIYKQLKETYKMPREAIIYRLKTHLRQNGLEKWNFAIGNAIRIIYSPQTAKQFFVETSYKLTNIIMWQKSSLDEIEAEQVEHL